MTTEPPQELVEFVQEYEQRTNSHEFGRVRPLIDDDAIYWFSDGTHEGIDEIEQAFDRAWNTIQDEVYSIADVEWLSIGDESASCVYTFHWEGEIEGEPQSGSGRGTSVFNKQNGRWNVVHEHLSTDPV